MPHPLILITAGIVFAILVLLDVMRAQRSSPLFRHGPTHQHPSRDTGERHRGGRVDQHADGVNL